MVTLRQFVVMWVAWVFGVEDCGLLVARVPVLCVEGCGLLVAAFQWSDWGGRLSGPSCGCTNGSCASVGNVGQCVRVCVWVCVNVHGRIVVVRGRLWLFVVKGACVKRIFNKHMLNTGRVGILCFCSVGTCRCCWSVALHLA